MTARPGRRSAIALAGAVVALLMIGATPSSATTIAVNSTGDAAANDGTCTLREAITSANTNAPSGALAQECAAGAASPTVDTIASRSRAQARM
jgi:CSLREA domain-containing protein